MGNINGLFDDPSENVQWMWNAAANPFSKTSTPDWRLYSDIENMIIEKALQSNEKQAMLDDYYIDILSRTQISLHNKRKQRPVRRVVHKRDDEPIREDRYLCNPVLPDRPFAGQYGFISPFIKETVKYLNLSRDQLPSKDESQVSKLVMQAAQGIIEEGKQVNRQREADALTRKLLEKKDAGMKEVWRCCAYIYTMNTFLYRILNDTLRLIGTKEHEEKWRSKIKTLGPFCLLLWDNPFNNKILEPGTKLYRGVKLSDEFIKFFKKDSLRRPKVWRTFQAFTSCSRVRSVAQKFPRANVLFIMTADIVFTADLSEISRYPKEAEELIFPGVSFTIDNVEYDQDIEKHIIELTLRQKHNSKLTMTISNRENNMIVHLGSDHDQITPSSNDQAVDVDKEAKDKFESLITCSLLSISYQVRVKFCCINIEFNLA